MASQTLSESEATRLFVQPQEGEHLPSLLKRCVPAVQTKRACAYNLLEAALRRCQPTQRSATTPATDTQFSTAQPQDYATVCANVTEDLKLCSEAILELRAVVSNPTAGPLRGVDQQEVGMVVRWLDELQVLEERKLVATASRHAVLRSTLVDKSSEGLTLGGGMKERVGKFVREVNEVHEGINELLQEMREYFLEHEDEG